MMIGRSKLLHTYGSVGKFKFIPAANTPYTGLFKEESIGLMRLSLALQDNDNYTPGIAFKFFTDKETIESPSIVVMDSVNGQGSDTNFFRKAFFNEVPPAKGLALKTLELSFQKALINLQAQNTPSFVPVTKLSQIKNDGTSVSNARSPRLIKLVALPEIKSWMDLRLSRYGSATDMRLLLSDIPPETTLYNVYGGDSRNQKHWIYMGQIVLTEDNLTPSRYGDEKLFFKHEFVTR